MRWRGCIVIIPYRSMTKNRSSDCSIEFYVLGPAPKFHTVKEFWLLQCLPIYFWIILKYGVLSHKHFLQIRRHRLGVKFSTNESAVEFIRCQLELPRIWDGSSRSERRILAFFAKVLLLVDKKRIKRCTKCLPPERIRRRKTVDWEIVPSKASLLCECRLAYQSQ